MTIEPTPGNPVENEILREQREEEAREQEERDEAINEAIEDLRIGADDVERAFNAVEDKIGRSPLAQEDKRELISAVDLLRCSLSDFSNVVEHIAEEASS